MKSNETRSWTKIMLISAVAVGFATGSVFLSRALTGERVAIQAEPAFAKPGIKRKHLPSNIIFPDQYLPLTFDHKLHVEKADVECTFCHDAAETSTDARDKLIPAEEICLGCHIPGEPGDDETPAGTCETCHKGYAPKFPKGADETDSALALNPPPLSVIPDPHLKMNHKVHVDKGVACETCHKGVSGVGLATRDNALPVMGTCLTCHTGKDQPALDCVTCHETKANGMMRTEFKELGSLRPSGRYFGDTHDAAFLKDHKDIARARGEYCNNCHEKSFCNDCHNGALRPGRVHPANWILIHPTPARTNDMGCSSCHRAQTFCVSCHQRAGVVRSTDLVAGGGFPSQLRFHPPGWMNQPGQVRDATHHGFQAQRNLRACASCHTEDTCTSCHATLEQKGIGVNPHPIGFQSVCRTKMRANPGTCTKCHSASDPSLAPCR